MSTLIEIAGDFYDVEINQPIHLTIADPPYGEILSEKWDKNISGDSYIKLAKRLEELTVLGGAAYIFGGIGTYKNRVFFDFLSRVEFETGWSLANLITWSKKRAYGVSHNYLFTREEIAYLVLGDPKKPRVFNIPLLAEKRGYPGYDLKHPAKSEYKRRTSVWSDVTEILRGKTHIAQKPNRLYEIMIETSSNPGDTILDPFAGSGTLAKVGHDRNRILVEKAWLEEKSSSG
jgi:DNA modification methylase